MGDSPNWSYGYVPTAQQWANAFAAKLDDLGYIYAQPGTGDTLESSVAQGGWILEPAGELAALAIIAPPGTIDGQLFTISTTAKIDALAVTATAGQTLRAGAGVVLLGDTSVGWKFRLSNSTWYRWGG